MRQIAVIGLGRFGAAVALTLVDLGHQVLGVDVREQLTQKLADRLTHVAHADCTDEDTLKALGLRNFDAVVVAIGHNLDASILVTVMLKEIGVPLVVAKAASELHGKVLVRVGADRVVYPERDMGARVAHSLVAANVLDYIELSPDYNIIEMKATPNMVGKTLRDLELRARFGINVMAIKTGTRMNISPRAEDKVGADDILVVLGDNESLRRVEKLNAR